MLITNSVYSISLSTNNNDITQNFFTSITVLLKGDDQNVFLGSAVVSLSERTNSLSGVTSLTTNTGICVFNIYFKSTGNKIITATSSSVIGTINILVEALTLKVISIIPTVRHI